VDRFNDRAKRAELFQDFFNSKETLDDMMLSHTRRQFQTQEKGRVYRPLTESDLLVKYHQDKEYVERVKEDCVLKRRMSVDPLASHDPSKNRYWILDDEHLKLKEGLDISTMLSSEFSVTQEQASSLTGDGGILAVGGQLALPGMSGLSVSGVSNDFFGVAHGDAPASGGKGSGKSSKLKTKGVVAEAKVTVDPAGEAPPAALVVDKPLTIASKLLVKLAKKSGEARQCALQMDSIAASGTLVAQLSSAADALEQQYKALALLVKNKVNDENIYGPYLLAAEQILTYYTAKKQYADAFISVSKRQATGDSAVAPNEAGEP
jgi:hypothetical protein